MNIEYTKVKDYLIPDIEVSPENKNVNIGKYGRLRERFLKEHKPSLYDHLIASEELASHLSKLDKEARNFMNQLVKEIAEQEGLNEELKSQNQIEWMQKMNNIKNRAEEIVLSELIYD